MQNVSPIEVGKYYLKAELNKLFSDSYLREGIDNTIDNLNEHDFWRFLEAISFTFRLNGIFWAVSYSNYRWSEEVFNAEDIEYVQMRPSIDKITFSPEINGNPVKFYDYLKEYFENHPDTDPEDLNQFRFDPNRPITYEKLFLIEQDGKIKLLDGGNRLIAGLFRGQHKITAYIARETEKDGKLKIGDSTFWLLGRTYIKAKPEDKAAVLKTIELLIEQSSDGKKAAQTYWLNNIPDPDLKKKCEELIRSK